MEYAIVDIETTGSYAGGNNITEIAILIHNGNQVIEKYQSLINPSSPIPFHIQVLTGISDDMVANAPRFDQIADQIFSLLNKRIFVAHNVNFDYSFIFQELKNAGYELKVPKLCTVRLAKKIIPNLASYSLGKLCQNLNIPNSARHRAMGDAEATSILFGKLIQEDTDNIIQATLKKTKEQVLPTHIDEEYFSKLPETAGIYYFKDKSDRIIYIGKAINIKKRVLNHFTGNNSSLKRQSFLNEIHTIDFEESGTELMALLMECQMIKKYWPKHNKSLKHFEPKFALIQYQDQNGYLRFLVSPFNKQANTIQFFERATEANQLLLEIMEKYNLESKLCTFYSTNDKPKLKYDYSELPDVDLYNQRIAKALEYIESKRLSFVIIDQGRTLYEKSYIYFKENNLFAFGFIETDNQFEDIEDLISKNDRCTSNYYMCSLVLQYAERFPSKVIRPLKKEFLNNPK